MPEGRTDIAPPKAAVPSAEKPRNSSLLPLATGVVIVAALYVGREVLISLTLAILLSFLLAPLVSRLRRWHLGRIFSVLLAVVFALSVFLMLGGLIGTQVAQLAGDLPQYQTTIETKIKTVRDATVGRLSQVMGKVGREIQQNTGTPAPNQQNAGKSGDGRTQPSTAQAGGPPAEAGTSPAAQSEGAPAVTPLAIYNNVLSPVLSPLTTLGIVFVVAIFILLQREDLRDRMIRLFGSNDLHRTTAALDDAAQRLSRYFLTQLGINASFGVVIGLGLLLIGVPSPVLWGVLAMLLRFVPYVGSFMAAVLPAAMAAAVDPGWSMVIWTGALFLIVETTVGQVVEPMVYGHSTGLSPVAVIVAAIFWSWIWGPIGLILSTPLTLCLVVLGRHVEQMEFLDVILGDRPALTPVENFYQRILADDPDEAEDQAELLLQDRSLSSYYDEVALKGLQLAATDAQRGVLSQQQLDHIKELMREIITDLDSHDDSEPEKKKKKPANEDESLAEKELPKKAPEGPPIPVTHVDGLALCVAGRGALDEAAAMMLAQLLKKHGLDSRIVPHEQVSRSQIATLDVTGVTMICVSYLEISGNPAHLRYLLRRLRQRAGNKPIIVGLWPAEEAVLHDESIQQEIGADHYRGSLRDTIRTCLEIAEKAAPHEPVAQIHPILVQSTA